MMESLRSATRNTAFERWLASTMGSGTSGLMSRSEGDQSVQAPASGPDQKPEALPLHEIASPSAAGIVAHNTSQQPANSEDSSMPEAHHTLLQLRDGGKTDSFGSSRMLSDTAASMHAIAPYLTPGQVKERTAESAPGPAEQPVLPAEAVVPGTNQLHVGSSEIGPFRPGWKVCNSLEQFMTCNHVLHNGDVPHQARIVLCCVGRLLCNAVPGCCWLSLRCLWLRTQDIFTINQKQLESAVRRVTGDPGLEPQRKDYLVQHIMASRYVVAQQMRLETAVVAPSLDPARTFAPSCAQLSLICLSDFVFQLAKIL